VSPTLEVGDILPPRWSSVYVKVAVGLDPALAVEVEPLRQYYHFLRTLLTNAAIGLGAALLSVLMLAAAGIYALMSFTVARRRHEIAIRTALGASRGQLLGDIFRQALWQISLGVAVGVAMALFIDYQAEGEALRGRDWLLLMGTSVLMGLVGLVAALGPARRGLRIEPLEALRGE
jgi:putative ABC transport system permease protein